MTELSRRRLLQGAAGGGAAVAAGTLGLPRLSGSDEAQAGDGLVPWRGPHQAGIVSARTEYAMAAAFEVVDDDLPELLRDITGRVAELTRGYPDRLDPLDNAALPPSDTGELGYDRHTNGRLTMTLGLGASLFDRRFGLRGRRPAALKRMPSFPGDNLDPDRLLGFPDGSQNIARTDARRIFAGDEVEPWARGGTYLAARLIRLKIERWDRVSRTGQEDSIGRQKITGAPQEGGSEQDTPKLGPETRADAHIRLANPREPGDEAKRFLRRSFVFNNGFDEYGLLDSGSLFMAFSRDVVKQFEATKRNTLGQELDEYMVGTGGGYFFCPPGVRGAGDYLARGLVEG